MFRSESVTAIFAEVQQVDACVAIIKAIGHERVLAALQPNQTQETLEKSQLQDVSQAVMTMTMQILTVLV